MNITTHYFKTMNKVKNFIQAVRDMRTAQNNYYACPPHMKDNKKRLLIDSKQIESKVDRMLKDDLIFCTCPAQYKTGETSVMLCNICGGVDQSEINFIGK